MVFWTNSTHTVLSWLQKNNYNEFTANIEKIFGYIYRPAVVQKICDLFSLVPSLEEQTPEYEVMLRLFLLVPMVTPLSDG